MLYYFIIPSFILCVHVHIHAIFFLLLLLPMKFIPQWAWVLSNNLMVIAAYIIHSWGPTHVSCAWAVVVLIIWKLDLRLPMQSVTITTNVGVRIPLRRDVLDITICDKVCQWLTAGQWFSPDTLVTSTNKTDCHDITGCKVKISHIKILYISLFVCTCMYV